MGWNKNRGVALAIVASVGFAQLGCGALLAPPARGDLDFAASKAFVGAAELTGGGVGGGAYQVTARVPVAKAGRDHVVAEAWYFGHDVPGEQYGWGLVGAGLRATVAELGAAGRLTLGFGMAAGCGGRYASWQDADDRCPPATASYVDVGAAIPFTDWLAGFAGLRVSRGWSRGRRADHKPPTTDWHHVGAGLRADIGPLFATASLGTVSYSNYHTDDSELLIAVGVGLRLGDADGDRPGL